MIETERGPQNSFVPFSEQEASHKVHRVILPDFDWDTLAEDKSQETKDHEYGWGNEKDPERIRFVEPNTPALHSEKGIYLEDKVALKVKERARAIRHYAESLYGIRNEEEELQNLLRIIPGFSEENLLKVQDYTDAVMSHAWVVERREKLRTNQT